VTASGVSVSTHKERLMDDAAKYLLRQRIASILDHPSVYMGGPSQQSLRKAIRIIEALDEPPTPEEIDQVKTWRRSPWDSLERI